MAAALLVSSILVASIPIPETSAATTTDTQTYTNIEYEKWHHVKETSISIDSDPDRYVKSEPDDIKFPMVYKESPYSATNTRVKVSEKVYISEDSTLTFVYHEPYQGFSRKVAILVNCSLSNLPGGQYTIPERLNGYVDYRSNLGGGSGNVAATIDGDPLFYKYATKHTRKKIVQVTNNNQVSITDSYEEPFVETKFNAASIRTSTDTSYVYVKDSEGNNTSDIEQIITISSYYTYYYMPCYSTSAERRKWDIDDVNLYKYDGTSGTEDSSIQYVNNSTYDFCVTLFDVSGNDLSSEHIYSDPNTYNITDLRLVDAEVMYVASEVVSKDNSTGEYYVSMSNSNNSVFGGLGYISDLIIPESIKGVGKFAFYGMTALSTVTFDDQIQVIGRSAFENNASLTQVNLGENASVGIIEQSAFKDCTHLLEFHIPKATNFIGDNAFSGDIALKTMDFSTAYTLAGIGNDAFYGCTALTNIDMTGATNLSQIGCHLFTGCSNIRQITFPASLQNSKFNALKIPISIFQGCGKLSHIVVPNKYMTFCDDVYDATYYKLGSYTYNFKESHIESYNDTGTQGDATYWEAANKRYHYSLGSFFDETANNGFYIEGYDSSKIHELTQANEVAFKYMDEGSDELYEKVMLCPKVSDSTGANLVYGPDLDDYDRDGNKTERVQYYVPTVFRVNASGELVDVNIMAPDEGVQTYDRTSYYQLEIPDVIGPYSITSIGSNFQGNEHITKATIPGTITSIANDAFKGCYYLNRVVFESPLDIAHVGTDAFKTQERSAKNTSAAPNSANLVELTFEGEISRDSEPFIYAMGPSNYINNSSQSVSYIDCYTGVPTNLHVKYNPDTHKSELQSVPIFYPDSETTPVTYDMLTNRSDPSYEFVNSVKQALIDEGMILANYTDYDASLGLDQTKYDNAVVNWINQALYYYNNNSGANKVDMATGQANAGSYVPSELTLKTFDSVYHVEIPSGVQTIKKNLFSVGADYSAYTTDVSANNPTNLTVYKNTSSKVNSDNIPILYGAFDHMGKQTGKYEDVSTDEKTYKNTVIESLILNSIEYIDPYAFYGLPKLTSITMYNSAAGGETIGDYAFAYCDNLAEVVLPASTKTMGLRPFAGDRALTSVMFSSGAESNSKSESGDNFSFSNGLLFGSSSGTKTSLVECLETRYNKTSGEASVGGAAVTASEIAGITSIADEAFMNCNVLTVDLSSTSIKEVPALCFAYEKDYPYKNGTSTVTAGGSSPLNTVILPSTCTSLKPNSFYNTGLANITMPSSVVIISPYAFSNDDTEIDTYVTVSATEGSVAYQQAQDYAKYHWTLGDPPAETFTVKFYDGFEDADTLVYTDYVVAGNDADAAAAQAALPAHDGYVFSKWKPAPTGIAEDMNTYALWEKAPEQTYTVTFYDWDLTVLAERTVSYGGNAEEPKSPTRSGYTFTGWTKGFTNVTENIQTMAVYTPNGSSTDSGSSGSSGSDSSGGSSSGGSSSGGSSTGGSSTGSSASGSKSSGSSGSSSSGSGGSNNGADFTTYTLTVINGSGSGSYVAGTTVLISAYTPSTGYTFDKWTSTVETTAFTNAEAYTTTLTMPASSTTVTANYLTSEGKSTSDKKSNSGSGTSKNSGSSTGSVSGNDSGSTTTPNSGNGNGNSGTTVDVSKDGISDKDVASATVNGSTDDFTVKIREDADATLAVATALKNRYGSLEDIRYVAMDISLYDESGTKEITDTSGLAVTVTIPIPDELRKYAGNNKVAAVVGNYELDQLTPTFSTINGVPTVTFTATHFSPYTVYVNLQNLSDGTIADDTPKTGDMLHPKWFLAIGLALASAVLFLKKDKKVTVKTA